MLGTKKQRELLLMIKEYKIGHDGNSPTLQEMGTSLGKSKSSCWKLVKSMKDRKVLDVLDGKIIVTGGAWTYNDDNSSA